MPAGAGAHQPAKSSLACRAQRDSAAALSRCVPVLSPRKLDPLPFLVGLHLLTRGPGAPRCASVSPLPFFAWHPPASSCPVSDLWMARVAGPRLRQEQGHWARAATRAYYCQSWGPPRDRAGISPLQSPSWLRTKSGRPPRPGASARPAAAGRIPPVRTFLR
jgi:hypothetical protein